MLQMMFNFSLDDDMMTTNTDDDDDDDTDKDDDDKDPDDDDDKDEDADDVDVEPQLGPLHPQQVPLLHRLPCQGSCLLPLIGPEGKISLHFGYFFPTYHRLDLYISVKNISQFSLFPTPKSLRLVSFWERKLISSI